MEVVRKDVLTVGGTQDQFLGVRIGEFFLTPDSDSGTRPDALKVEGPGETLLLHGGQALRVKLHSEGISRKGFLGRLTLDQERLLMKLAFDLPGRGFPASGELLQKRWETIGEDNITHALQALFKGVEGTIRGVRRCSFLPLVGKRLSERLYPYIQN